MIKTTVSRAIVEVIYMVVYVNMILEILYVLHIKMEESLQKR